MNKNILSSTIRFFIIGAALIWPDIIFPDNNNSTISIDHAVAAAIKNSREILFSARQQALFRKNLKLEYRKYLPEANISYTDTASVSYYGPDSRMKKVTLGFTQLLYDRGITAGNIRIYRQEFSLHSINNLSVKNNLIYSVINAFTQVLSVKEEIRIYGETYSNSLTQLDLAVKEFELGKITEIELMLIKLKIKEMEIILKELSDSKERYKYYFESLIGNPSTRMLLKPYGRINTEYSGILDNSHTAEYYIKLAEINNPLLREKRIQNERSSENLNIAKKRFFPDIKAGFDISAGGESFPLNEKGFTVFINFDFSTPGIPSSLNFNAGKESSLRRNRNIYFSSNPFSSLNDVYSLTAAELEKDITFREIQNYTRDIYFEIKKRLSEIGNIQSILNLEREKIEIEIRLYNIEELRFRLGEIKRSEIIDKSIDLAVQKSNLIKIINSLFTAEIDLLRFCGEGYNAWKTSNIIITENRLF